MAEFYEERPNSDVERVLWFASLEPTQPNLNFEDFKAGVDASEEIFTTIQELIAQAYYNNNLDNETSLPNGPDFRDAVTEVMAALVAIFETVPAQWLKLWIEALLLDIRNNDRVKMEEIREGKKPSPPLVDSPTTGKDAPRISLPPPPCTPPKTPVKPDEPRESIEEKLFGLEVFPANQHKLTLFRPSIVEIIAVQCVPRGRDPRLVESYQLDLFIKAFEELLNTDPYEDAYEFAYGKLVYYYQKSGTHIGLWKGTRIVITNQQEFETGVRYLLSRAHKDTLVFTFYQETAQDKGKRAPSGGRNTKGKIMGELSKLTGVGTLAGSPRRLSYIERIGAAVRPKGKETAETLPADSPSAPMGRKQPPGKSTIPRKVWGGPYKSTTQSNPSKRKLVPATIHVRKLAPSAKPLAKEAKNPSSEKGTDPIAKSIPQKKTRGVLYPDSRHSTWEKPPEDRLDPPSVSTPATTNRLPPNPPYGIISYPGARAPPPLRRKRALMKAVTETVYTGQSLKPVSTGTSSHSGNAALFSPGSNKKEREEEEVPGRKSFTPRISQEQQRICQETGFRPQPSSPAVKKRNSIASKISARKSLLFPPVANIKNIFNRGSKDLTPVEEVVDTTGDFYAEISRRTYSRGGEQEAELSIQRLKDISNEERMDDPEVEEPEEPDDFENLDEYLATRLQVLQNMKELTQIRPTVDSARWIDCCRLFDIKPEETGLNSMVELAGLRTPLYQYQAYAVYWQLQTSRATGGGFVADEAGLGKTLSFLAYMVAERQLSWLWDEVQSTRAVNGPRHRKENEPKQTRSLPCPTSHERPGWIACPCSASSPTSKWAAKKGVRLACVPQSLITNWISQWNIHIDTTEENLALRLIVAHDAANPIPAPSFGNADARHARNFNEMRAKRNVADSKGNKYNTESPRPHQDRYLVLTTPQSYKTWVKRFEYEGYFLSFAKSINEPTWLKGKSRGIVFGLAMVDECHEEYIKEKGRSGVLSDLPLINNPFIWGYSGTPLGNTPRTLEGVLWAIEQHFPRQNAHGKATGWDEDPILGQYHYRALDTICTEFEKNVKNRTGNQLTAQKLEHDFKPFLLRFMIRRTADSTWFDRPLIKLKKHIHQDIVLAHNPKFDGKLADLQKVIEDEVHEKYTNLINTWKINDPLYQNVDYPRHITFNQRCRLEWRLRVIATFPALVPLTNVNHKHHLALTTEEVKKYKGTEVYKSPYSLYLKHITANSAKCIWLKQYILELLQTKDIDGKDQKLVIMTQFNSVALIIKLFIERLVLAKDKKNHLGLVCAGMKARERTAILDAFTDAIEKDTGLRKQKNDIQILIGTTRLIGVGLQLTRAANLVLMEPDYEFYRELQAVARIHRIGQRNLRSYSFRLVDEGSEIENRIVKRQEQRRETHGRELQTQLISEVTVVQQEEVNSEAGLMIVDEEVREEWTREHEELLQQFPVPPAASSSGKGGPSEGSTAWTGVINAANEVEGEYDDLYDADVGR